MEDGFTIYSLWRVRPSIRVEHSVVDGLSSDWAAFLAEIRPAKIYNDQYNDLCIDMALRSWPPSEKWVAMLEKTLQQVVASGAVLAWIGLEGQFTWPGLFLTHDGATEEVYAAYSLDTGFLCISGLDEAVRFLPSEDVASLRAVIEKHGLERRAVTP